MGFCAQFLASPAPPASHLELWTSRTTHWSSHSHNTPRLQLAKSVLTSRIELCGNDHSMKSSCRKGFVNALGQYDRSHFFTEGFMTTTLLTSFAFPVYESRHQSYERRGRGQISILQLRRLKPEQSTLASCHERKKEIWKVKSGAWSLGQVLFWAWRY